MSKNVWEKVDRASKHRPFTRATYRVQYTGRGKNPAPIWQVEVRKEVYLNWADPKTVAADILKAAEGMVESITRLDSGYEGSDPTFIVQGWVPVDPSEFDELNQLAEQQRLEQRDAAKRRGIEALERLKVSNPEMFDTNGQLITHE